MSSKFLKKKEDFICAVCGKKVVGSGFTNHCPECLWSKHVDINPGDRAADCKGLMEPIGVEQKKGEWRILFKCQKCGYKHWNRTSPSDKLTTVILNLVQNRS
ncbi:RNHCP domain-containing protein [Candidatus Shapirobacteria bacterium]|nr:RNHCP domain-containing protein [Candidatus Shapirobacteria bacterium]